MTTNYVTIIDKNGPLLKKYNGNYSIEDIDVNLVDKWFPFTNILPDPTNDMRSYTFWKTFWGFNYFYKENLFGFILVRFPIPL